MPRTRNKLVTRQRSRSPLRRPSRPPIRQKRERRKYLTPKEAVRIYRDNLTSFEHKEIHAYAEVYYVGQRAISKVVFEYKQGTDVSRYFDNNRGAYRAKKGDHIAYRYEILADLGRGSSASVVRAFDHKTERLCAIRIVHSYDGSEQLLYREISILEQLNWYDVNKQSIVDLQDHFWFREHKVMIFECLSFNLHQICEKNGSRGLNQRICRNFAKSILVALDMLHINSIVHADLKPENILLTTENGTGLKLIDFGLSYYLGQKPFATYVQSRFYRAPEVILGGPYTTVMDMWSFGCILMELITGFPIFPGSSKKDQLCVIMEALGLPPVDFLRQCRYAGRYFSREGYPYCCDIFVNREENFVALTGKHNEDGLYRGAPGTKPLGYTLRYLTGNKKGPIDDALTDLINRCLTWDPAVRIRPCEALLHNWISGFRITSDSL